MSQIKQNLSQPFVSDQQAHLFL